MRAYFIAAWVGLWLCVAAHAKTCDLVIRHARIVDGTGAPSYLGDVAVDKGKIIAVGDVAYAGKREVDAQGLVVAPGFIDVHTHAENLREQPLAGNFLRMGVTTLVLGNCGSSRTNLGDYFKKLEAQTFAPNVASLIGQGSVRRHVMGGNFDRPPTPDELAAMRQVVRQAMRDGAVGLSTGLIYQPGIFTKTEEIVELAKVAASYDGIYATHMRHEGDEILDSLSETFRIAREAKIRAEVSHIKLAGRTNWGRTEAVLAALAGARAEGLKVTEDEYVYTASSTTLSRLIPAWALEGGRFKERLEDPASKARIIADMRAALAERGATNGYDYAAIASCRGDASLNGMRFPEAARRRYGSDSIDSQIALALDIELQGGGSGVFHTMAELDVQTFLRATNTMIAADSEVHAPDGEVPHPRGYGNNARVLGHYVRELQVLGLEDAVRKMTSLPARTFQLAGRGEIRKGNWADLVIFDPATVADHATFESPHQYATGFKQVLVNGVTVVEEDSLTGAKPGKILRHKG